MTITERVSSIPEAEARLKAIATEIVSVVHSKALSGPEMKTKLDALEAEYGAVETGLKNYQRGLQFRAGSEIGAPPEPPREGQLVPGRQLSPLSFDYADLKMCHEALPGLNWVALHPFRGFLRA
jgi:hypothetical protein